MEFLLFSLVVLFIFVMAYILWKWWSASNIRKLAADGWVFYYSPTCGFCEKQINEVGASKLSWMPMVNCETNPSKCDEKGIKAFPTWLNEKTGQVYEGAISLDPVTKDDEILVKTLAEAPVR